VDIGWDISQALLAQGCYLRYDIFDNELWQVCRFGGEVCVNDRLEGWKVGIGWKTCGESGVDLCEG